MPDELDAHKFLLESMREIKSLESIKGVARVFDKRIGNQNTNRIYLFLPDLHIITRKYREKRFEYGFNHERLFVDLLKKIIELRQKQNNYSIIVCQLGDFVDLWRENVKDPEKILLDFQGVRDCLFDLDAWFILGNHDVEIARVSKLSSKRHFRLFFPDHDEPKVYVTHGDVFDWIEGLPDELQRWAVYLFAPKEEKPAKKLKKMIKFQKNQSTQIDPTQVFKTGRLAEVKLDWGPNDITYSTSHKYLESCFTRVDRMNKEKKINMTAAVVGHTHEPRIGVLDEPNRFFVLMDCGSWHGKYQENESEPKACCQVGVACGNDFRIYQLDPNIGISPQFEPETVL